MTAQTQLIPASELGEGQAAAIRNEIIRQVVAMAMKGLGKLEKDIVVRDIRPLADLDYTYEDWRETTGATANTYEDMCNSSMADGRWVVIFGVKIDPDSPSCSMLRFSVGGAERAIWQLQALGARDDYVGLSPFGIVIPPNAPYIISRYVRSVSKTANIVLKGVVVESRGKVVSP